MEITKNIREFEALQHYVAGETLSSIARIYGVSRATVGTWRQKYNWEKSRQKAVTKAQHSLYQKLSDNIAKTTEDCLKANQIGSQLVLMRLEEVMKRVESAPNKVRSLDANYKTLKKWIALLADLARIQKYSLPNASEELSKKIYDELQRIGKAGLMPVNGNGR